MCERNFGITCSASRRIDFLVDFPLVQSFWVMSSVPERAELVDQRDEPLEHGLGAAEMTMYSRHFLDGLPRPGSTRPLEDLQELVHGEDIGANSRSTSPGCNYRRRGSRRLGVVFPRSPCSAPPAEPRSLAAGRSALRNRPAMVSARFDGNLRDVLSMHKLLKIFKPDESDPGRGDDRPEMPRIHGHLGQRQDRARAARRAGRRARRVRHAAHHQKDWTSRKSTRSRCACWPSR